ncbi:MAG: hypothetical protein HY470_00990 [Candidatus Ryanbacteria bacterium]|nr:hypothetical protein [Candidatus Ryanbacteria bacterium]
MNRERRQLIEHPLAIFVTVTLALVFAASAIHAYIQKRRASAEYLAVVKETQKRKDDIEGLEKKLSDIESGSGLEREARETMNMKKEGEHVLIVVEDGQNSDARADVVGSVWQRIKHWFGFD